SGKGQVVDAAMIDGASLLMTMFHGMLAAGSFVEERGTNMLDTGAHYYNTYETADGKYVSVGSIEPQFYAELLPQPDPDRDRLPARRPFPASIPTRRCVTLASARKRSPACARPARSRREAAVRPPSSPSRRDGRDDPSRRVRAPADGVRRQAGATIHRA